jgi:hypothetical protein
MEFISLRPGIRQRCLLSLLLFLNLIEVVASSKQEIEIEGIQVGKK